MTDEEIKLLESLLGKLAGHLRYNFCVLTGHVQDGFYLGVYDQFGNRISETSGPMLIDAVNKAKIKLTN